MQAKVVVFESEIMTELLILISLFWFNVSKYELPGGTLELSVYWKSTWIEENSRKFSKKSDNSYQIIGHTLVKHVLFNLWFDQIEITGTFLWSNWKHGPEKWPKEMWPLQRNWIDQWTDEKKWFLVIRNSWNHSTKISVRLIIYPSHLILWSIMVYN